MNALYFQLLNKNTFNRDMETNALMRLKAYILPCQVEPPWYPD